MFDDMLLIYLGAPGAGLCHYQHLYKTKKVTALEAKQHKRDNAINPQSFQV